MATTQLQKSTNGRISIPPPIRTAMSALGLVAPPLATHMARTLYFRPRRMPAKPPEHEVLTRGTRFHLVDAGTDVVGVSWGRGPVIALVHGWSGALTQLTPFVDPLVRQGFQVVGFDWPGHGQSGGNVSSLLHASRVLNAVGELFGPFEGVVAHSFGAAATVYATANGLDAKRFVFHAPVARLSGYIDEYSQAWGFSESRRKDFVAACEAWLEKPFAAFEPLFNAPKARRPTLVIHSEDDREVSIDDGRALAAAIGAELREKSKLGHRRLLADPTCVAETVEFLTLR